MATINVVLTGQHQQGDGAAIGPDCSWLPPLTARAGANLG